MRDAPVKTRVAGAGAGCGRENGQRDRGGVVYQPPDRGSSSGEPDEEAILKSVAKTGCVVTAEEHNILGGLGESVARVLALNNPAPQEFVAVMDSFGESGTPAQLMEKYKLNSNAIIEAVERVTKRK